MATNEHSDAVHAEVGAAPHGGGMPQLRQEDWAPQLVWLLIVFVALYLLMARVALPRIATVLEERRDKIADDLDQAAQLKTQTDEAIESYETALAEARSRAHAIAAETRQKLQGEIDDYRADIDQQISTQTEAAEAKIAELKESAMSGVREAAIDITRGVVEHLANQKASDADLATAVDARLSA